MTSKGLDRIKTMDLLGPELITHVANRSRLVYHARYGLPRLSGRAIPSPGSRSHSHFIEGLPQWTTRRTVVHHSYSRRITRSSVVDKSRHLPADQAHSVAIVVGHRYLTDHRPPMPSND